MTTVIRVIETVLPVVLALMLGVLCRSKQIVSRDGVDTLKRIAVNIALPAVLLNAFVSAEYTRETLAMPLSIFALNVLGLVLGWLLGKLLRLPGKLPPFYCGGAEAGMLGYALFTLLYPNVSSAEFAILDLGQVVFVFTLYKALLSGKNGLKGVLKDMLSSPVIWALVAGITISATGLYDAMERWEVRGILDACTNFIAAPASMLILLSVGYDLVLKEIRWKETFRFIVLRFASHGILMVLMLLINRYLLGGIAHEGSIILLFILPTPYVLSVFVNDPEERTRVSSSISAITLVSLILFAVMAALI